MPVKIRLTRQGRKKKPIYHIVVADSRAPRDGRFIERLGLFNPNTNPATIDLNFDKALDWLQKGAQPTDTCHTILSQKGVLMKKHLLEGAKKGAFSEEEAHKRFDKWIKEKEARLLAVSDKLQKEKDADIKKRLENESKIREAIAQEVARKRAAEAAEEKVEEAAVTEESVTETTVENTVEETPASEEKVEEVALSEESATEAAEKNTVEEEPRSEVVEVAPEAEDKQEEAAAVEEQQETAAEAVEESPVAEEQQEEVTEPVEEAPATVEDQKKEIPEAVEETPVAEEQQEEVTESAEETEPEENSDEAEKKKE